MTPEAYLQRISCQDSPPTLQNLCQLQEQHLRHVPFETLSLHLDQPIDLNTDALLDKIVQQRRGGFCYELNSAFGWLLQQLGHEVQLLMTQPFKGDGTLAPPFAHLALKVRLQEQDFLVDVGFADGSIHPFPLLENHIQHGCKLQKAGDTWTYTDLQADKPLYVFTEQAHPLAAFQGMCTFYATAPDSGFRKKLYCGFQFEGSKDYLSDHKWVHKTPGGQTEQVLDFSAFQDVLTRHYGVPLSERQVQSLYEACAQRALLAVSAS